MTGAAWNRVGRKLRSALGSIEACGWPLVPPVRQTDRQPAGRGRGYVCVKEIRVGKNISRLLSFQGWRDGSTVKGKFGFDIEPSQSGI